jgi:hypothetical protein
MNGKPEAAPHNCNALASAAAAAAATSFESSRTRHHQRAAETRAAAAAEMLFCAAESSDVNIMFTIGHKRQFGIINCMGRRQTHAFECSNIRPDRRPTADRRLGKSASANGKRETRPHVGRQTRTPAPAEGTARSDPAAVTAPYLPRARPCHSGSECFRLSAPIITRSYSCTFMIVVRTCTCCANNGDRIRCGRFRGIRKSPTQTGSSTMQLLSSTGPRG